MSSGSSARHKASERRCAARSSACSKGRWIKTRSTAESRRSNSRAIVSLAAASARESLANARAVPRYMLRGNWSSTTISASAASGVACQRSHSPRAARSQIPRKRRRTSASNGSDFWNHSLRGRPRSRESAAPNQKSSTSTKSDVLTEGLVWTLRGESVAEAEVGESDQHRGVEISAQDKQQDGCESAQSERRQELFPMSHGAVPVRCVGYSSPWPPLGGVSP